MAIVARVNGTVQAGAFYGYAPVWVRVAGTAVGTVGIDNAWERAVRAIQTLAATVIIGTPTANVFMVVVDNTTANLDGNGAPGSNAGVIAAILGATGITCTVTTNVDLGTTLPV